MEKSQIIIIASVAAFAAIRLYQKYNKKKSSGTGTKVSGTSDFATAGKDDEYEPYSKK